MISKIFSFGVIEKLFLVSGMLDIMTSLYKIDGINYIETNPIFIFVNNIIHTWYGKLIFVICYAGHITIVFYIFRGVANFKNKNLRKFLMYIYLYLAVHLLVLAINNLII